MSKPTPPAAFNVLVGFWRIDGVEHSNEVRLTGNGVADKHALRADITRQHPAAAEILPLGTRIETRTPETAFIEARPGDLLRNIFVAPDGKEDPVRKVGEVWFDGAPFEIFLLFSRAQGAVLVRLRPRVLTSGSVQFPNLINPQRSLSELPSILAEVFSLGVPRDLKLNIREIQ